MGMIIVIIFAIYILVGFFLSKLVYKIFRRKLISRLFLTFFIVFPFWDVLLQEATAIYYNNTYEENKVYSQAELNRNGKVESIGYIIYGYPLKSYTKEKFDKYYIEEFNLVSDFLEFQVKNDNGELKILKVKKISQGNYEFYISNNSVARYKIFTENKTTSFYHKFGYLKIVDTKENKIMAESFYLYFKKFNDNIRTNVLKIIGGMGRTIFSLPNNPPLHESFLLEKIGIKMQQKDTK